MPYCEIHSPVELPEAETTDLLSRVKDAIHEVLGVPVCYIMCSYSKKQCMTFGGEVQGCCFVRITTIAEPVKTKSSVLAPKVSDIISKKCKIDNSNIFVHFVHAPGKNFAQGGSLFG